MPGIKELEDKLVDIYLIGNHHIEGEVVEVNIDDGFIVMHKQNNEALDENGKIVNELRTVWIPMKNILTITEK